MILLISSLVAGLKQVRLVGRTLGSVRGDAMLKCNLRAE